jgi:hypothetical protein
MNQFPRLSWIAVFGLTCLNCSPSIKTETDSGTGHLEGRHTISKVLDYMSSRHIVGIGFTSFPAKHSLMINDVREAQRYFKWLKDSCERKELSLAELDNTCETQGVAIDIMSDGPKLAETQTFRVPYPLDKYLVPQAIEYYELRKIEEQLR